MKPGEHVLINGYTGTGKTNLLAWIVKGFLSLRTKTSSADWETLVWFDRGKSSELEQAVPVLTLQAPHP